MHASTSHAQVLSCVVTLGGGACSLCCATPSVGSWQVERTVSFAMARSIVPWPLSQQCGAFKASLATAMQELSMINTLAQEYIDAWRTQHVDVDDVFTVWDERTNARAANKGLRIDYVLCSPGLHSKVTDCQVKLDIPQARFPCTRPACACSQERRRSSSSHPTTMHPASGVVCRQQVIVLCCSGCSAHVTRIVQSVSAD
jgi:hypothetical protein